MVKLNMNKKALYIWLTIIVLVIVLAFAVVFGKKKYTDSQWGKAREAYKLTHYAEVVDLVGKLSEPKSQSDLSLLAHSYLAVDNKDKALELFNELSKEESNIDAKLVSGNILRDQGKFKEAEDKYKEVMKINTGYIQAYLNLASMYKMNNQAELANETLTEAVKYNPTAVSVIDYRLDINADKKGSDVYKEWEARGAVLRVGYVQPTPSVPVNNQ